jgi:hypothetical protein
MASCSHSPPEHVILSVLPDFSNFKKKDNNIHFYIYRLHLIIIDCENLIEKCPACYDLHRLYICGQWPDDVYATFDGVANLPIQVYNYNVTNFEFYMFCDEPRFGNFIYNNFGHTPMFIVYCKFGSFKATETNKRYRIEFNGKLVACCRTSNKDIILVDEDGQLLDIVVVHSDDAYKFKVGNGYLTLKRISHEKLVWIYTNEPSYAKPVAISE